MSTDQREPSTDFGKLLDKMLHIRKVSQHWLGNHSLLGPDVVCRLRKGKRRPTELQILRMAVPLLMKRWQIEGINALMEAAEHYIFPLPENENDKDRE